MGDVTNPFYFRSDNMMEPYQEEIRLENALKRLKTPQLKGTDRILLRNRILHSVHTKQQEIILPSRFLALKLAIMRIAKEVFPDERFKILLRQKLLAIIGYQRKPSPFSFFWRIFEARRAVSFATLLLFSVVTYFSFFANSNFALAAPVSFFEEVRGNVSVIRRGEEFRAMRHFQLHQNDLVKTQKDASATIHFLDDSAIRLSENSSLKIDRMSINPRDHTETKVSLSLNKGRLYASILNLVNNTSQFEVKTKNVVAKAHRKSAFDVSVGEEGKTKISAVAHALDVKVSEKKKETVETTLTNGFSLEVANGKTSVKKPKRGSEEDKWITENIQEDEKYVEDLKERYREKREDIASSSALVIFDDVAKQEAKLRTASARLIQAETLLQAGREEDAAIFLDEFQDLIQEVNVQKKTWQGADPKKAARIEEAMNRTFNGYKKQFALYLPSDATYPVKEQIAKTEILLADDSADKNGIKLAQAEEKLIEATDLQTQGLPALAAEQVQAYSDQVSEVTEDIKELSEEEQEAVVPVLLDENENHLKLLGALAETAKFAPLPALNPGETRGIDLREILVAATQDSLTNTKEVVAETNVEGAKEKIAEISQVKVNGESVVSAILPAASAAITATSAETTSAGIFSQASETPASAFQQIIPDIYSGVTVITIEAKVSAPKQ